MSAGSLSRTVTIQAEFAAKLALARQRAADRVAAAYAAVDTLSAARATNGQPPPVNLQRKYDLHGNVDVGAFVAALSGPPPTPKSNAAKIRPLRVEETRLRAQLQAAFEERQEREVDAAAYREEEERVAKSRAQARAQEVAEDQAAAQRETDKQASLAAAHIARTGV